MVQLIAFGHSITYGYWDTEGGWVQRLRSFLDERALEEQDEELVSEVLNLGIPGETSEELLQRFEPELEHRLWGDVEQVVIIQIGANDIQRIVDEDRIRVSREEYRENILQLIEKAYEYTEHVLVVSELYTGIEGPIPWDENKELSDERLGEYVDVQREVCEEKDVELIDLRSLLDKEEWLEMLEDGSHPDNEGHQLIFEEVKNGLEREDLI